MGWCARSFIFENIGIDGPKIPVGGTVGCLYDVFDTRIVCPSTECPDQAVGTTYCDP